MKQYNYQKGKTGEQQARDFLEDKGYQMIEINHRNQRGEIDLIMRDNDWLVFVEVKLKTSSVWGEPEEMIDKRKLFRVKNAAEAFLVLRPDVSIDLKKFRIDAVCITCQNNNTIKINHYRGIY